MAAIKAVRREELHNRRATELNRFATRANAKKQGVCRRFNCAEDSAIKGAVEFS